MVRSLRVTKQVKKIQFNCCRLLFTNLQLHCSKKIIKCFCPKANRRDRIFLDNVAKFRKEIHIQHILKSIRVLKGLARQSLTKE